MQKDSFLKNSLLLILSNLTTGVLGFTFSIILSRQLGAEGMGLYGLIMPIYNLFICLVCGGLVAAVSKIAAEYYAKNDFRNLRNTIKTVLIFTLFYSTLIVSIVFIFAAPLSMYIIRDSRTILAIKILCPAMVFIALSNSLKGFFYGVSNVAVPAIIDISEKGLRIAILLGLMSVTQNLTVTKSVTIAYAALCIGELLSLILLFFYYKRQIKKCRPTPHKLENKAQLLYNTISIAFPLMLTGLITSLLSTCSTLLVPRRLLTAGIEYSKALGLIGMFNGMALAIISFPMIVVGSISTLLIPDLSQSVSRGNHSAVNDRVSNVLSLSFLLGCATLAIALCIPTELGIMFFKKPELAPFIKAAAISCPVLFCAATTYGILNGLGKQNVILFNSIITAIIEIILLYVFAAIPSINVYAYAISLFSTSFITLILNLNVIRKYTDFRFKFFELLRDLLIIILTYILITIFKTFIVIDFVLIKNVIIILSSFTLILGLKYIFRTT